MRPERDSLGEIQVPMDVMYGAQTQRAVETFTISGLKPRPAFVWSLAVIKHAAAEVNRDLGQLDKTLAKAIIEAAQEVADGKWNDHFVIDPFQAGAGTSQNMNMNEVIANRATLILGGKLGEYKVHPNDHVNMSQSTNDTIPTAIRLGCLWRLDELMIVTEKLSKELDLKAKEFDDVLKSGRTHLQDAVPIRLGQEFSGYAKAVERDGIRIKSASEGLRRLGIGGTAVGTGLNAHPEYHSRMVKQLAKLTGFRLVESDNLFESMQSMSDAVDFSAALRTLALTMIRIANDFRLLASGPATGLDEIRLPAVQPGSSIMPGKVNPVLAEMLDMAMMHVIACDEGVSLAAQAGQLELNVMMPLIAYELFEMMHIMISSLRAFSDKAVHGVQANRDKASGWLERNAIIATALNPLIGYDQGASLVKEALNRNIPITSLALDKARQGELMHRDGTRKVSVEEIQSALGDLRKMTGSK